ncbi:hypothetical protein, partial [Streptosporangium carneum]|uniref:hypothetical protein n=1 Tax=Streptosporangium carneum TaxID=47481 RepID=UPI0022F2F551
MDVMAGAFWADHTGDLPGRGRLGLAAGPAPRTAPDAIRPEGGRCAVLVFAPSLVVGREPCG